MIVDVVAWFFVWHLLGRNGFQTVETLWNLNRLEGKSVAGIRLNPSLKTLR